MRILGLWAILSPFFLFVKWNGKGFCVCDDSIFLKKVGVQAEPLGPTAGDMGTHGGQDQLRKSTQGRLGGSVS